MTEKTPFYKSGTSFYNSKAASYLPACTFAHCFTKPYRVMRIPLFAFLLFSQSFIACQQVQEKALPLAADLTVKSPLDPIGQGFGTAGQPAAKIIFQSADGGQSWQDISAGLPGDMPADETVECFLAHNGEVLLSTEQGLYRSLSSSAVPVWGKDFVLTERTIALFPGRTGPYALSIRSGFFQNMAKDIWAPAFADLKKSQMLRTALEAPDGAVFVGCDNGIFKSADQGKTWKHVFETGWVREIVESGGVLIATNQGGILRSTDGGEHWDVVLSEGGVGIAAEVIEGGFAAITYNTESETRRVRISADGGKTWQPIDAGLPPSSLIASIKQLGKDFFCGHPDGIFRSSDRGKTWERILPSIGKKVFNLSVSGKVIYAVPRNGGC
jgi:photosystem II stability/assembly factor-like uncharacterized protein